jgi:hypothetical protein
MGGSGCPDGMPAEKPKYCGDAKIDGEMIDHVWTERRQFRRRKRKNREAKKWVNEDENIKK